jgi:hypothetical protein
MKKEQLEKLIKEKKSIRQIAEITGKGKTTIHYWLKVYDLKTDCQKPFKCKCGESDPNKFYGNKKRTCAKCHNKWTLEAGQKKRKKAIEYLGGKCILCGYDKYYGSIDLHHLDPSNKDKKFDQLRGWSWERIKKEIENCVPLCRNCHGEVHAGITDIRV